MVTRTEINPKELRGRFGCRAFSVMVHFRSCQYYSNFSETFPVGRECD